MKEIYIRDIPGNPLVLYEIRNDSLFAKEFYLYGMQRLECLEEEKFLGKKCYTQICKNISALTFTTTTTYTPLYFGRKRYELNDWLGNVRVVVNDRKTPVNSGSVTVSYISNFETFQTNRGTSTHCSHIT